MVKESEPGEEEEDRVPAKKESERPAEASQATPVVRGHGEQEGPGGARRLVQRAQDAPQGRDQENDSEEGHGPPDDRIAKSVDHGRLLLALHPEPPPRIVPGRPHHGEPHQRMRRLGMVDAAPAPQSRLSSKTPTNRAAA